MPSFTQRARLSTRDLTIFASLSTIMFLSRILMQWIPNVHVLGLFIAAFTLTYRGRALIPLYGYILLDGVFAGFALWWIPQLYIWLPLWLAFLLAGKLELAPKTKALVFMLLCALHGLSYGILYAPLQALLFGLSFQMMIAWIIAGFSFDIIHAAGNFVAGTMILPLSALLKKLDSGQYRP